MSPYIFKRLQQKVTKRYLLLLVKRFIIVVIISFLSFLLLNIIFPLRDAVDYSTIITDERGEMINAYLTKDEKWRMKTELNEISPLLRKTIIAKEDRYFYHHPGVNPVAIMRAAFANLIHMKRTSGASTITMQLARALEKRPRNLSAKLIEMFRALQLEWKYSKDEILQMYLNLVPYGGNIEGVKSASLLYFKKNPDHLSLAEITALSIIPNRPSSLVIGRKNQAIQLERNKWLHRFAEEGVFTKKEIEDALAEPLLASRTAVPHLLPHLARRIKKNSEEVLVKTFIDVNTQMKVEKLTADYMRGLRLGGINQAAVIIIDNKTHRVVSYLGSADFRDTTDGGQVNGAAAVRQPGSTLKPLLYGICFDEGLLTPKTVITDVPVDFAGYRPENYDRNFSGYVTVEHALAHSLNIPAVKSLQKIGVAALSEKLIAADFKQIRADRSKLGLSMALGGCGASLEEMTGLFSAFASDGLFTPPIYSSEQKLRQPVKLVSPAAAFMVTEILSQVNRPDFPINWSATEHMPKIAWKTGTSYGRRDAWSIGYNRNFTVGIWVGNFSGIGSPQLSGANTATPLLFRIFNSIDYDSDSEWFSPPAGCELRQVCSETGLPPGPDCENRISDYFIPLVSSSLPCNHLQDVKISADGSISYCASCAPATGFIKKRVKITSPEMQLYFDGKGMKYEMLPPHNPDCERIFRGEGPAITSLQSGSEYLVSKTDPEPLMLSATAGADVSRIYWYINDRFYKTASPGEKQFFMPGEGPVKISCADDKGRNRSIRILVRHVNL